MTPEQKQQMIIALEKMDNVKAFAGNRDGVFFIESYNSVLPVNRIADKLQRRGARVDSVGPGRKMITFDISKLGAK